MSETADPSLTNPQGSHYHFDHSHKCPKCGEISKVRVDPYLILSIYQHILAGEHQHAVKKLLRCGQSKAKDLDQDIAEVILTLQCWQRRRKAASELTE
jgi:hypothetical protein